jgi:hypothetical protein
VHAEAKWSVQRLKQISEHVSGVFTYSTTCRVTPGHIPLYSVLSSYLHRIQFPPCHVLGG